MSKILKIENIAIKVILGLIGLVMVIAGVYAKTIKGLMLTDKEASVDWWFVLAGFVLGVGAFQYNRIVDTLLHGVSSKFFPKSKKNENNNDAY